MNLRIKIGLCLLICFHLSLQAQAKQHPLINQIASQTECGPNIYFSWSEINSPQKNKHIQNQFQLLGINTSPHLIRDLNLMPVNRCIFRGNRRFKEDDKLKILAKLKLKTFLRLTQKTTKKSNLEELTFLELPISGSGYPGREGKQAILGAFELLAQATPDERVYLSCFFGKHRTGLIVAMYQFAREYAESPIRACTHKATVHDQAFRQMNSIAALDFYTYDMPTGFRKLYSEYTQAVCKSESQEFFNY